MTDHPHLHLRAGGSSVVLDCTGPRLPRVLFWGPDLGELDDAALAEIVRVSVPPNVASPLDVPVPVSLLAEQSAGWLGTPGRTGHCAGRTTPPPSPPPPWHTPRRRTRAWRTGSPRTLPMTAQG